MVIRAGRRHNPNVFNLQPGDLVFFNGEGHVSIYVGDGLMIDAPRTGEQVRLLPLDTAWYAQTYDGAVRP